MSVIETTTMIDIPEFANKMRYRAYNNMCYLIEKYAPIEGIDKYDSRIDPSLTGARIVPHLDDDLI